jgi:TolB-like protein
VVLVRNGGHLITKDELLSEVWPDTVVAEVNLSVNISALRKALGDDGFIETVPKRGYRFIAPVEVIDSERLEKVLKQRLPARISVVDKTDPEGLNTPRLDRIARHKPIMLSLGLILVIGMAVFWYAKSRSARAPIDSIAVLPFVSNDAANNYLADGLSEATINGLSRVAKLRVAPRTNVLRYKSQPLNLQQAGQELGVEAIVTGQGSQKNDVLTIKFDLIDVRRNSEIFTSQYTGKPSDIILLQTRILNDVSRALNVSLTEPEQQLLAHRATENADAYRAYLEGRYFWKSEIRIRFEKSNRSI